MKDALKGLIAEVIADFMKMNCRKSRSIILAGSRALGEAQNDSDVDLIVVTCNIEDARDVKESLTKLQSVLGDTPIDCKVCTDNGFVAAKSDCEHLFLWTVISNGSLPCGEDIRTDIKLNPRLIAELMWRLIKNLDTSCDLLRARSHFTGCCCSIYYALLTSYFIERFVLQTNKSNQRKHEFMQARLQSVHDVVKERYKWVTHHVPDLGTTSQVRIPTSADRRYSATEYVEILNTCGSASEYLKNEYSKVTKWAEQFI